MKGIGVVFSGGGGKGAYEIGVWKYMHEVGLDRYVRAVSGTSVGALNAALFVGSTYETAEKIWLNIKPRSILSPKKIKVEDITKCLLFGGIEGAIVSLNPALVATDMIKDVVNQNLMLISFNLYRLLLMDSYFSREGIIELINERPKF